MGTGLSGVNAGALGPVFLFTFIKAGTYAITRMITNGTTIRTPPTQSGSSSAAANPTGTINIAGAARLVARASVQPGRSRSESYQSRTNTVSITAATAAAAQCHPSITAPG